jgi:PAS domain S-box-containing protein
MIARSTPFARFRLIFCGLAVIGAIAAAIAAVGSAETGLERAAGAVAALTLAGYWITGYRRGRFPLALEAAEALAVFVVLKVTPGDPLLPLLGLMFRSLYGGLGRALGRYALWMGLLLLAHADRGSVALHEDVTRAVAVALAPIMCQALLGALRASETIQRRLTSVVENSTDIVTIVGADLRVRWQATSIRSVLGHDADALLGTRLHELVHPDDRPALDGYFAEADDRPGHTRNLTLRLAHGDGGHRDFEVVAANRLHDRSVGGYVLNMRDATDRHALEQELRALAAQREHDAMHDPLTGLANRR